LNNGRKTLFFLGLTIWLDDPTQPNPTQHESYTSCLCLFLKPS